MSAKILPLRPRAFTSAEAMIDQLREEILRSGITYERLARDCNVSKSTVNNLASGRTKWPRPTTLFPLAMALGLRIQLTKE